MSDCGSWSNLECDQKGAGVFHAGHEVPILFGLRQPVAGVLEKILCDGASERLQLLASTKSHTERNFRMVLGQLRFAFQDYTAMPFGFLETSSMFGVARGSRI
jgi:hypothetical protein